MKNTKYCGPNPTRDLATHTLEPTKKLLELIEMKSTQIEKNICSVWGTWYCKDSFKVISIISVDIFAEIDNSL